MKLTSFLRGTQGHHLRGRSWVNTGSPCVQKAAQERLAGPQHLATITSTIRQLLRTITCSQVSWLVPTSQGHCGDSREA